MGNPSVWQRDNGMKARIIAMALTALVAVNPTYAAGSQDNASVNVVLKSEVKWEPLNPSRGDKSPQAGTLWGDRKGAMPTGFLVNFVDGFLSPPRNTLLSWSRGMPSAIIRSNEPSPISKINLSPLRSSTR